MELIDSHCHLDFEQFDTVRDKVLARCQALGVKDIIVPAVTAESWPRLLDVCQPSPMLHSALGLHPMFMSQHKAEHIDQLHQFIKQHNPIAIGEIGLDFYLPEHDKQAQIDLFTAQLKLAQQAKLPVLLHVRKAHDQTISLLKKTPVIGGIIHAFNGSLQQAKQYQQLGFVFGVGGAITHPKATRLRKLVSELPLSSLVLETDAPDMPVFGQKEQAASTPENIPIILDALIKLRPENKETIASATTENCQRVLNLNNSARPN